MAVFLKKIFIDNFKSYNEPQWIDVSTLNVFMGANSSGKSTALQTLLTIKQTIECNSPICCCLESLLHWEIFKRLLTILKRGI